jgi:hypothetical protein
MPIRLAVWLWSLVIIPSCLVDPGAHRRQPSPRQRASPPISHRVSAGQRPSNPPAAQTRRARGESNVNAETPTPQAFGSLPAASASGSGTRRVPISSHRSRVDACVHYLTCAYRRSATDRSPQPNHSRPAPRRRPQARQLSSDQRELNSQGVRLKVPRPVASLTP